MSHIAGIFSAALYFHAGLHICAEPLLNAVLDLSLMLEYWDTPFAEIQNLLLVNTSNRNANGMHGYC